jgi:glycine cleavage system H lipoate-binding protein
MDCPFLRDAHVKYCRSSALRKMIVQTPEAAAGELCTSGLYRDCGAYRSTPQNKEGDPLCPWYQQMEVQYCGAAAVRKFVPYNESPLSRCRNEGYRYCELYMGLAGASSCPAVEGIRVPEQLYYAPNHMWLDPGSEGDFHIGIDGFLARVLGAVERISFLTLSGVKRPAAVLTAGGVDLTMVFPKALLVTGTNIYLRASPAKLTADPFTAGWLFQAAQVNTVHSRPLEHVTSGMLRGEAARRWIAGEVERLSRFVHDRMDMPADGGVFASGVLEHLSSEDALMLVSEFFGVDAHWKHK